MHKFIFLFSAVIALYSCKDDPTRTEIGDLKVTKIYKYTNSKIDTISGPFDRNFDIPAVGLFQELIYITQKKNTGIINEAFARSPAQIPYYTPDSIEVETLSPYNNIIGANSDVTQFMGYVDKYNTNGMIYRLNQFKLNRINFYNNDEFYLLIMENPTTDSIRLKIKFHYNGDIGTRTTETKWIKFK